jgi:hypothetical protein
MNRLLRSNVVGQQNDRDGRRAFCARNCSWLRDEPEEACEDMRVGARGKGERGWRRQTYRGAGIAQELLSRKREQSVRHRVQRVGSLRGLSRGIGLDFLLIHSLGELFVCNREDGCDDVRAAREVVHSAWSHRDAGVYAGRNGGDGKGADAGCAGRGWRFDHPREHLSFIFAAGT